MEKEINKYDRKLGSKKKQGIVTPKMPRTRKCGCFYRNLNDGKGWNLWKPCYIHGGGIK